jgi:hypothetical protein
MAPAGVANSTRALMPLANPRSPDTAYTVWTACPSPVTYLPAPINKEEEERRRKKDRKKGKEKEKRRKERECVCVNKHF